MRYVKIRTALVPPFQCKNATRNPPTMSAYYVGTLGLGHALDDFMVR
jgi:hypothetical protein